MSRFLTPSFWNPAVNIVGVSFTLASKQVWGQTVKRAGNPFSHSLSHLTTGPTDMGPEFFVLGELLQPAER